MPSALGVLEVVVGLLLVGALAFLGTTYARRRTLSRGGLLMLCGWRQRPADSWHLGHVRLGSERLEWFGLIGFSTRPRYSWDRAQLDLEPPQDLHGSDAIDLLPDAAPVRCTYGNGTFELALTPNAYTALRSWAEASPPGSAANVA